MNDIDVIRALETLNERTIELRASDEYAAGVRKKNLERLLGNRSLSGIKNIYQEFKTFLAFSKAPRHPASANLTPDEWIASLRPGRKDRRVVVYSCIVGDYDTPRPPLYRDSHISYVLFRDTHLDEPVEGWDVRPILEDILSLGDRTTANRYIKFHPYELFASEYDATVYVDGNVQPISDLSYYVDLIRPHIGIALHSHRFRRTIGEEAQACKASGRGDPSFMDMQLSHYAEEGFPLEWGLLECNVIAADLHNVEARTIFSDWWDEFLRSRSGRDQLALPYVLWRHGIAQEDVAVMGRNVYADTKVSIVDHGN